MNFFVIDCKKINNASKPLIKSSSLYRMPQESCGWCERSGGSIGEWAYEGDRTADLKAQ